MTMTPNLTQLTRQINQHKRILEDGHNGKIIFRDIQGYKGMHDRMLEINTVGGWCNLNIRDILKILDFIFKNEDRVYPKDEGMQGRDYLFHLIQLLHDGRTIEDIWTEYGDKHTDI